MSFNSKSSKSQAQSTVNKLLSSLLPGTALDSSAVQSSKPLSSAQVVSEQMNSSRLTSHEIRKLNKLNRLKQNRKLNKNLESNKKFLKLTKYNIIKQHKQEGDLTEEESKYLSKLVRKNSNMVRRFTETDDYEIKSELKKVRQDILSMTNETKVKKSKRIQNKNSKDFKTKIEKGLISYPGLTPGLAPVGLDDESDDE